MKARKWLAAGAAGHFSFAAIDFRFQIVTGREAALYPSRKFLARMAVAQRLR
jgi:hypothetical protein